MNCNQNTSTPTSLEIQYFTNPNCFDCQGDCGGQIYNSKCVIYTGPNLSCSGVNTNDSIEAALQKIDEQICGVIGDYSQYNMHCLPTWWGETITTQSEFVDAITSFICDLSDSYSTFTTTTFPDYTDATDARIDDLEVPGITCSFASVINTDTLSTVLSKYCTAFSTINNKFDLSTVVWDNCYTVTSVPETLPEAFQLLADQICDTKSLVVNSQLPNFNNYGSCINGSSSDSLVTTIGLIKTRLCLTPTFNINTLDWTCLTKPSSNQTDLQSAFQTVLDTLSDYKQNKVTYSDDFIITPNDSGDPCEGVTVSLADTPTIDRFVAATPLDSNPGTLYDKLEAGDNITLDYTDPEKCVITSTVVDTYKVKSDISESDGMAGYLTDKLKSVSNKGIGLSITYDDPAKKTRLTPSLDEASFWDNLYLFIKDDVTAKTKFCDLVSSCVAGTTSQYRYSFVNNGDNSPAQPNVFTITDVTIPSSPVVLTTVSVLDGINIPLTGYFDLSDYHQYEISLEWTSGSNEWGGMKTSNDNTGYVYFDTGTSENYSPNPIIVPLTALPGNRYKIELFRGNNA